MSRQTKLTPEKMKFILDNKNILKQYEIAEAVELSPATVCNIINNKWVGDIETGEYFSLNSIAKHYQY